MKVLLQNRNSFRNSIAGDGIQLIKTKEYLEKLQVNVEISSDPSHDLSGIDLVHIFNIMPVEEVYPFFQNANRQGKKIVLSPIFWDPREFLEQSGSPNDFQGWWLKTMPLRLEILNRTAMILPNSKLELAALESVFPELPPAMIVPNAADIAFAAARPERFIRRYQWRDFVLSVGRICRRKNQLALIKAMKALKLPLVLIGPLNDSLYYRECRRQAAGGKTLFLDCLKGNDLASAYAAAKVHALVSWYDTPGLVSLEAALAGCNIVSTDRGSAREYFGGLVDYCDPGDPESIKNAVANSWHKKPDRRLKQLVLEKYTWEKAALATLEAYKAVTLA